MARHREPVPVVFSNNLTTLIIILSSNTEYKNSELLTNIHRRRDDLDTIVKKNFEKKKYFIETYFKNKFFCFIQFPLDVSVSSSKKIKRNEIMIQQINELK